MLPNVATLPITVGVGAFLVRERDLLVVRKTYGPSKGLWTIPSGYVERHESIVQSVERDSASFTRAIVAKLTRADGLQLDSYQPPPDPKDVRAYLLYL